MTRGALPVPCLRLYGFGEQWASVELGDGTGYVRLADYEKAVAENEELRKLVRDMFEEIEDSGFDPFVERQGKRGPYYEEDLSWRVGIRERMRKLGIEV